MDFAAAETLPMASDTTVATCAAEGLVPASRTLSKKVLRQVDELERLHLEAIMRSSLFDGGATGGGASDGPWNDDEILRTLDYPHEERKGLLEEHEETRKLGSDYAKELIAKVFGGALPAIRVTQCESVKTFLIEIRLIDAVPVAR